MTDGESTSTSEPGRHTEGPLSDIVVADLTRALSGPHAAMLLGDLGARVIKVESPAGDDARGWGPPWASAPHGRGGTHDSTYFMSANRNKESVVADLKTAEGRELLERLVRRADVLLENFRVGVLDRLGFSLTRLHELNPRLVIGSITGFGHDGPAANRAGYDQIAQGEGGLMSVTGAAVPTKLGVPIADLLAGMNLAYGVTAALHERHRTGRGRVVRTSLLASVVGVHAFQGTRWTIGGEVPGLSGAHHPAIAPYGLFATATAPLQISVGSESLWRGFAPVVGLDPSDPRFATNRDRVRHRDELIELIERAFAVAPAQHWLRIAEEAGIPAGMVRTIDDVYAWDQTRSQGLVTEVDHPAYGRLTLPGSALRFDDSAFAGGRERPLPPPLLGEHGAAIRAWLDGEDDED
jgi:crotonobetainyl-CoA:carnitine CoA-transferase CaiB-like acyl-CoA transferase